MLTGPDLKWTENEELAMDLKYKSLVAMVRSFVGDITGVGSSKSC